jgi:hypothetical protein
MKARPWTKESEDFVTPFCSGCLMPTVGEDCFCFTHISIFCTLHLIWRRKRFRLQQQTC